MPPDAAGRYHDHPGDEPDDPTSERGRETEFEGGIRSSGRIDKQANDQPGDSASYTGRESGDTCPPSKHRHATYPGGERVHTPHYRMYDRRLANARLFGSGLTAEAAQWVWFESEVRAVPAARGVALVTHKPVAGGEAELAAAPPYRFVPADA